MTKSIKLKDKDDVIYPYPYYPVGSIYLSVIDTNPTTFFGGKWEQIAQGRTLVGVDTSQSEFNTVKKTGGSKYLQNHSHNFADGGRVLYWDSGLPSFGGLAGGNTVQYSWNACTKSVGSGNSENLQPYFTCYIWLKISN